MVAQSAIKKQSLFSVAATTNLGSWWMRARCSICRAFGFPDNQSSVVTTLVSTREATFVEWAATLLRVGTDTDVMLLTKLLKERGHMISLEQAEEMVEKTKHGEGTGIRTSGWGNFFFLETRSGPFEVGDIRTTTRDGRTWELRIHKFDLGGRRWEADGRWNIDAPLLVRNLDTSNLLF